MELYIEYVIIDNFSIDLIIILLTYKVLKEKPKIPFVFLSATLGTVFAIITPFITFGGAATLFLKTAMGLAVILTARPKIKRSFYAAAVFFAITFLMGGASVGVCYLLEVNAVLDYGLLYSGEFPLGAMISGLIGAILFVEYLIRRIKNERRISKFVYKTVLTNCGKSVTLKGFLDSGNFLEEKIFGQGIAVAYYFDVCGILENPNLEKMSEIKIKTADKTGTLRVTDIEKIEIYDGKIVHTNNNVLLGISIKKLSGGDFDMLLNPLLLSEEV